MDFHGSRDDDGDKDRISNLPVCILRIILFYLPVKEEARTRVLSKSWNTLDLSHVSFDFSQMYTSAYRRALDPSDDNEIAIKFVSHVEEAFQKLNAERLEIPSLRFFSLLSYSETIGMLDICLALVARHYVKELCIEIFPVLKGTCHKVSYKFPEIAIASTTPLLNLTLGRCVLQPNSLCDNGSSIFGPLPLRRLSLVDVTIDNKDGAFQNFISRCHSLEYLSINRCTGLKNLRLCSNPKVETLIVSLPYRTEEVLESIEVGSLNLQTISYIGLRNTPLIVQATRCRNLLRLHIDDVNLEYHFVHNLADNFPLLEDLLLYHCKGLGCVSVLRHPCLKHLDLESYDLNELDVIDTPNLVSFKHMKLNIPTRLFSSNASSNMNKLEESHLCFSLEESTNTLWFVQLKSFLGKFHEHNLTLRLSILYSTCKFNVDELSKLSSPLADLLPCVKTLDLRIRDSHFTSYGGLFDGLFWFCRPKTINIPAMNPFAYNGCLKMICNILVTKRDGDTGCCNCSSIKCWHRCLKNVSIYLMPDRSIVDTTSTALLRKETRLQTCGTGQDLIIELSWDSDSSRQHFGLDFNVRLHLDH